eukprot:GCRY01002626.1.p1 GENE.GCRY01002626.1~~GCRY01002626.1.p1  ORF type:complete len:263 (+),score=10.72 GCRY01002626.1:95-883(+)
MSNQDSLSTAVGNWYSNIPLITRRILTAMAAVTLAANFGFLDPFQLAFFPSAVYNNFHIWRPFTAFLFLGKLGFGFLIHMMFVYQHSKDLESVNFAGRTADYAWCLTLLCFFLIVIGGFWGFYFLGTGFIMGLVYIWSKKNPTRIVSFFFGARFQAMYFPFVLLVFNLLMGNSIAIDIAGIVAGHLYYFLDEVLPLTQNIRLVRTPAFFKNFFTEETRTAPQNDDRFSGFNAAGARWGSSSSSSTPQPRGHDWGRGNSLGSS